MKKLRKDIFSMTGTGVALGVGGTVIGKAGGSSAGITAVSGFMPAIGAISGSSAVFRQLKKLKKK